MSVIGFSGRAGAGKDTAALLVKQSLEKRGLTVELVAFADPIKACMKEVFMVDASVFSDRTAKETPHKEMYGFTPRKVCQLFGTEMMREMIQENIWLDRLHKVIDRSRADVVLVTDVRFENENESLWECGHVVFFIDADERLGPMGADAHMSERAVYNIRADPGVEVISNNGSAEEFARRVEVDIVNKLIF
jgi:hypothetical protein